MQFGVYRCAMYACMRAMYADMFFTRVLHIYIYIYIMCIATWCDVMSRDVMYVCLCVCVFMMYAYYVCMYVQVMQRVYACVWFMYCIALCVHVCMS